MSTSRNKEVYILPLEPTGPMKTAISKAIDKYLPGNNYWSDSGMSRMIYLSLMAHADQQRVEGDDEIKKQILSSALSCILTSGLCDADTSYVLANQISTHWEKNYAI